MAFHLAAGTHGTSTLWSDVREHLGTSMHFRELMGCALGADTARPCTVAGINIPIAQMWRHLAMLHEQAKPVVVGEVVLATETPIAT